MKKVVFVALAFFLVFAQVSFAKPRLFEKDGFSISIDEDFVEEPAEKSNFSVSCKIKDEDIRIEAMRVSGILLQNLKIEHGENCEISEQTFCTAMLSNIKNHADESLEIRELNQKGLTGFEISDAPKSKYAMITCHKSAENLYLVLFLAGKKPAGECRKKFGKWAKTVSFLPNALETEQK